MKTVLQFFKEQSDNERIRAEVYIINKNNELCLAKYKDGDKIFTIPGGGVQKNEEISDAMERECLEEVGIKIKNPKLQFSKTYDVYSKKHNTSTLTIHSFKADFDKKDQHLLGDGPEGNLSYEWVNPKIAITSLQNSKQKNISDYSKKIIEHAIYFIKTHLL